MKVRAVLALLLLTASAAVAYRIHVAQEAGAPASLTAYVPPDALLTIESPDFASLLQKWTGSAESKAWLASDNYSVFQNSRLFGRLGDAQTSFETVAGVPAGVDLLHEVAGKQSVFAWYDIGKLEFLYITRMPAGQMDKSALFQARASFQRRHAGNSDFYIRTAGTDYSTVAFARVAAPGGDMVLLATREDLMANALKLMASGSAANSVGQEPWFRDVSAALPAETSAPALHMVLNLERIAADPHFRSYWIQRNVSRTKQFRAATADLYVGAKEFREERVLLPKDTDAEPAMANLGRLAELPSDSAGVYRVVATGDPAVAVAAIEEKLLGRTADLGTDGKAAPDPSVEIAQAGSVSDLETRIDAMPAVSAASSTKGLARLIGASGMDAVLTVSSAESPAEKEGLWVPMHSAVVVETGSSVDEQALASALQETLGGELTTAGIGIGFQQSTVGGAVIHSLTGPRHFYFAVAKTSAQGCLVLLADDQALLSELVRKAEAGSAETSSSPATLIAVFNHSSQRAPYLRLTSLIDGTQGKLPGAGSAAGAGGAGAAPAFFSQNIGSLSESFADLQTERVVERVVDSNLRQTVTYRWGNK
jgi:hypothetical protein